MGKKGKDKPKLRKYEMEVDGRIIDLRRFAYDYLFYSVQVFGISMNCIMAIAIDENDYPVSNFVQMIARLLIRLQISNRNSWKSEFQKRYEVTKFVSFPDVKRALIDVFNHETLRRVQSILMRTVTYLSVIGELILFLYTADCNLFFLELSEVWPEFIRSELKLFAKHGGLVALYMKFRTIYENDPMDQFLDKFIPAFASSYTNSSFMCDYYISTESKYKEKFCALNPAYSITNTIDMGNFFEKSISEQDAASRRRIPPEGIMNTGLGIRPHEEWLQLDTHELEIEAEVSPQSASTTSGREAARIRRENRKEKMKRTPSSRATEKPDEQIKVDLLGTPSASLRKNHPVGSYQETPGDYEGSIRRDSQRTSSILSREDIERVTSSFVSNVPSQYLPGASSQGTSRGRKKSSIKKKDTRQSSSSVSGEVHQRSDIAGATSAVPPQIQPGPSRQETSRGFDSTFAEELKKLYLSSSKREPSDDDKQM